MTIGQASRIPGVTPAALSLVHVSIKIAGQAAGREAPRHRLSATRTLHSTRYAANSARILFPYESRRHSNRPPRMPRSTAGSSTITITAIPSPRASSASIPRRTSRAAGTTSFPPPASRASSSIASSRRRLDALPGAKDSVLQLAGTARRPRESAPKPEKDRHAVLAEQRHHVRLHGRCRHRRIPALASAKKSSPPPISSASLKPSSPTIRSPATPPRSAPSIVILVERVG